MFENPTPFNSGFTFKNLTLYFIRDVTHNTVVYKKYVEYYRPFYKNYSLFVTLTTDIEIPYFISMEGEYTRVVTSYSDPDFRKNVVIISEFLITHFSDFLSEDIEYVSANDYVIETVLIEEPIIYTPVIIGSLSCKL